METSNVLKITGGAICILGLITVGWYSHPMVAFGAFLTHWGLNINHDNQE